MFFFSIFLAFLSGIFNFNLVPFIQYIDFLHSPKSQRDKNLPNLNSHRSTYNHSLLNSVVFRNKNDTDQLTSKATEKDLQCHEFMSHVTTAQIGKKYETGYIHDSRDMMKLKASLIYCFPSPLSSFKLLDLSLMSFIDTN